MKNFIGIDLGTTNSAICSYDGESVRVWKSPEQNDVTPSAISYDRRGNKYVGKRAYDAAPQNPQNAATLFKRIMGTKTPIHIAALDRDFMPEECSAEILKTLFGYLPEEMRSSDTGTVITVPASFNQMQKTATREAAERAGLGAVALMQEPVAAIMSVMRVRKNDGMFLIYDLGGGTLDIAIAESIGRKVNLLAHGGIAMCGGRDFDRGIFTEVIRPWLEENFSVPDDIMVSKEYQTLVRLALWAAEKAKIELSAVDEARISLTEFELRTRDLDGEEIYLDIPLTRADVDAIIEEKLLDSVAKVREIMAKNNLSPADFDSVIFIGGPTNYKPLRDRVAFELGIASAVEVNPMTAVAEGAAIYAESIDWESTDRHRKDIRGSVSLDDSAVSFNYIARTSEEHAKLAVKLESGAPEGLEFQVVALATGWTSGRAPLTHGRIIDLMLSGRGENRFKITVYDSYGAVVREEEIVIERVATVISAIPASHSIGVEVLKGMGSTDSKLEFLVQVGDSLPKKGQKTFKATKLLTAGAADSLNFRLWEGEIEEPVSDNRYIGVFKIHGSDIIDGAIPAGADLVCDYEMKDDGSIDIEISVPQIGSSFRSDRNFYSRQEGAVDYTSEDELDSIIEDGEATIDRIDRLLERVDSDRLAEVRDKIEHAMQTITESDTPDAEPRKEIADSIYEAKRVLYEVRRENAQAVREAELARYQEFYDNSVAQYADASEQAEAKKLLRRAQSSIRRRDDSFGSYIKSLWGECYAILWRQDWFVIDGFKRETQRGSSYLDRAQFDSLVQEGYTALENNDMASLRRTLIAIYRLPSTDGGASGADSLVNIIRG